MRVRFNHRIDLCTEVVRQDADVFFGLQSGEVYIISFATVGLAEQLMYHMLNKGFADLSDFKVMDKNWQYL